MKAAGKEVAGKKAAGKKAAGEEPQGRKAAGKKAAVLPPFGRATCNSSQCEVRYVDLCDASSSSVEIRFNERLSLQSASECQSASERTQPGSPRAIGAALGSLNYITGQTTDGDRTVSFVAASTARSSFIRDLLLCPGVRGPAYEHLYGCAPQGVLHSSDIAAACRGDACLHGQCGELEASWEAMPCVC
ncbi:hypothetical protein VOLCADRAFT_91227 [Volvox carteri f. nagariensis]|uniref:Uncharacterized protein n=1 Tax=Volvox carteri f. nagariensis TaxID=3068 RepID=D8TWI4_VOLCA|nr:uncharacterized protein VOLCADRAFT_91227 [Volvox carteri f. nagariensis]EFJ48051.1 hypothetical protein VOLCADRAFT_91227 [Volvox carteri f. nagariensis]|eukprot:XP_002950736.1 hypothetical protein VOLCADRAFT_91227 [Volvox carteri f. nagariensis]